MPSPWELDLDEVVDVAERELARTLTDDERRQYYTHEGLWRGLTSVVAAPESAATGLPHRRHDEATTWADAPRVKRRCHPAADTEVTTMASSIDTVPDTTDTPTGGVIHPPRQRRPTSVRRTALAWGATVAACLAVAALAIATVRGGNDADNTPPTRLDPRAEPYEREAHLEGQAKTYGRDHGADNRADAAAPARSQGQVDRANPAAAARLAAQAEQYERQAHLDGQAKTYSKADELGPTGDQPSNDGFVPGSRRMPLR
jgi:hypothetical protein